MHAGFIRHKFPKPPMLKMGMFEHLSDLLVRIHHRPAQLKYKNGVGPIENDQIGDVADQKEPVIKDKGSRLTLSSPKKSKPGFQRVAAPINHQSIEEGLLEGKWKNVKLLFGVEHPIWQSRCIIKAKPDFLSLQEYFQDMRKIYESLQGAHEGLIVFVLDDSRVSEASHEFHKRMQQIEVVLKRGTIKKSAAKEIQNVVQREKDKFSELVLDVNRNLRKAVPPEPKNL